MLLPILHLRPEKQRTLFQTDKCLVVRAAAWFEEMMFYCDSLPCHPCPHYSHCHSESNGDGVFWSRILSGPFDEESAKAIDYLLAHLFVLCIDLKKRGDSASNSLRSRSCRSPDQKGNGLKRVLNFKRGLKAKIKNIHCNGI